MQHVDVLTTLVHEPTDEPEVTEDDRGHFGDVLVALPLADVATMIHQTGHKIALTLLLLCAFFDLWNRAIKKQQQQNFDSLYIKNKQKTKNKNL